jgi:DNA replication protein DnaC
MGAPREPGGLRPSGTGKTFLLEALVQLVVEAGRRVAWFLLEALGQLVVEAGRRVAWFTLEHLGGLVYAHRADDTVTKAVTSILRAQLVVIDDIGLLPVSHDAAEGLYRIVDAAYVKRSIALSSNLHPAGFDELMPKDRGHRHRRPAAAPRPRLPNQRRLDPPHPRPRRERSTALH